MNKVLYGDAEAMLKTLPDGYVNCCITSPPYYGLRDYGVAEQIGLEDSPEQYIDRLVRVFREVHRVMKDTGTLWIVIADSYAGSGKGAAEYPDNAQKYKQGTNKGMMGAASTAHLPKRFEGIKPKDLIGIPWMLAFVLRADGWYLRQDIIWHKPNPMPESVRDRCTKAHEYVFLLSKSPKYFFDYEAMQEDSDSKWEKRYQHPFYNGKEQDCVRPRTGHNTAGMKTYSGKRNKRDVWKIAAKGFKGAHFATFPEEIVLPCLLAGCPAGGTVLDPFLGSGTTLAVAAKHGRNGIGIELNEDYKPIIEGRIGAWT